MGLVAAVCTQCGAGIKVDNTKEAGICEYCGTAYVTEKIINQYSSYVTNNYSGTNIFLGKENSIEKDYRSANELLKLEDFERATQLFEKIVLEYPADCRGWWGLAKCKYKKLYYNTYCEVVELLPYVSFDKINNIVKAVDLLSNSDEYRKVTMCEILNDEVREEYLEYQNRLRESVIKSIKCDNFIIKNLNRYGVEYRIDNWIYGHYLYFYNSKLYMLYVSRLCTNCYSEEHDHSDISHFIETEGICDTKYKEITLYEISEIDNKGKIYSKRKIFFSEKFGHKYQEEEICIGHLCSIGNSIFLDFNFNKKDCMLWEHITGNFRYITTLQRTERGRLTIFGLQLYQAYHMPNIECAISMLDQCAKKYQQQVEYEKEIEEYKRQNEEIKLKIKELFKKYFKKL